MEKPDSTTALCQMVDNEAFFDANGLLASETDASVSIELAIVVAKSLADFEVQDLKEDWP